MAGNLNRHKTYRVSGRHTQDERRQREHYQSGYAGHDSSFHPAEPGFFRTPLGEIAHELLSAACVRTSEPLASALAIGLICLLCEVQRRTCAI